jgi:predicted Zn-dependent protease
VRDLFERAVSGLAVNAVDEKTVRGVAFRSVQGSYACTVPEGFAIVRPPDAWLADAKFEGRSGVVISIISAPYDRTLADQMQEMLDYYRDTIKLEEGAQVAGADGFTATVTKPDAVTLIAGTVRDRRVHRVHTAAPPSKLEEAKRVHDEFLKGFRVGRQS